MGTASAANDPIASVIKTIAEESEPDEALWLWWDLTNKSDKEHAYSIALNIWSEVSFNLRKDGAEVTTARKGTALYTPSYKTSLSLKPAQTHQYWINLRALDWSDSAVLNEPGEYSIQLEHAGVKSNWVKIQVVAQGNRKILLDTADQAEIQAALSAFFVPQKQAAARNNLHQYGMRALPSVLQAMGQEKQAERRKAYAQLADDIRSRFPVPGRMFPMARVLPQTPEAPPAPPPSDKKGDF